MTEQDKNTPDEPKLLGQHIDVLRDRAIPPEFAMARGVRSIDLREVRRRKKEYGSEPPWPHLPLHPVTGLLIPYQDCADGIPRCRVRSDVTSYIQPSDNEGTRNADVEVKVPKYIAQATVTVAPYLLRDVLAVAGDTSVPLFFTEAPLKALSLTANGFLAIGLGGVSAGAHARDALRELDEIVAHPELQRIRWVGRRVYIVYDAGLGGDDAPGNPNVAQGAARLWRALQDLGADVHLVRIPYFHPQASDPEAGTIWNPTDQGPDDFIAREGVEKFRELVDVAVPADPVERMRGALQDQQVEDRSRIVNRLMRELWFQATLASSDEATLHGVVEASHKIVGKRALNNAVKEFEQRMVQRMKLDDPKWYEKLTADKSGNPKTTINNITIALQHAEGLKGLVAYNEFTTSIAKLKVPPWKDRFPAALGDWTETDTTSLVCWLEAAHGMVGAKPMDVVRAVQGVAEASRYHPVREYFEGLVWDGVDRLETWLRDYFHVEDSPYTRWVSKRWMISAVARTYEPGCQADYTLILEGKGRIGKSSGLRTLGGEWHSEPELNLDSKEAVMLLQGSLILEFAEGQILKGKASVEQIKRFTTVRYDDFVPKYSNIKVRRARCNVFAMTLNPRSEYLVDETGSHGRWLPVNCGDEFVDSVGLQAVRDLLWAEAVTLYKAGEQWHPTAEELKLAEGEQKQRERTDMWDSPIRNYLSTFGPNGVTSVHQVVAAALPGVSLEKQDWRTSNRVANVLRRLGWVQDRKTPDGNTRLWSRGPDFVPSPAAQALAELDTGVGITLETADPEFPDFDV